MSKAIEWGGNVGVVGDGYGRAKRRMYKKERKPARLSCSAALRAPVELPDATPGEVSKALFCFCEQAGLIIGDAYDYDPLRDEYTCVAKNLNVSDPKVVAVKDVKVAGSVIAMLISFFRQKLAHQAAVRNRAARLAVR
jgi:hypothetical protein